MIKKLIIFFLIISLGLLVNAAWHAWHKSNTSNTNDTKYEPYSPNHQILNDFWAKNMYGDLLNRQVQDKLSDTCMSNMESIYKWGALLSMDDYDLSSKNKQLIKKIKDCKAHNASEYKLNTQLSNRNAQLRKKISKQKEILLEKKYVMPTAYILSVAFAIALALFVWGYKLKKGNNELIEGKNEVEKEAEKVGKQRYELENAADAYEQRLKALQKREEENKVREMEITERENSLENQLDNIHIKFSILGEKAEKYKTVFEKACEEINMMKKFVRSAYKNNPKKIEQICFKVDQYVDKLKEEVK